MKQYLIGTDIGTSGTKTIMMDTEGELLSSAYAEYGVMTPRALWAEQWPDVWVDGVFKTIKMAVAQAGVDPGKISGICVSGLYGGSGIPCDADMTPVRPCLIWMDRRAHEQSQWVAEHIGLDRLYAITKNGADPYYGFTKILWIKDNEPENWAKTHLFLPPNAYVIYQMTGEIAIDHSSAGNIGGIFDTSRRCWSDEMLKAMGIPRSLMPERIVPSSEIVGGLTREAARRLGLREGTPVCAGGVDCVVATLGLGVVNPGQHVAVIGTSMTWGFVHDQELPHNNLICMPYVKDPQNMFFTFGGAATAGALPKWFRDQFAELEKQQQSQTGVDAYQALEHKAKEIPPGSDGLLVLPYFMGERAPIWDVHARGTIMGLSLYHTKVHVYRAFLESVAFSLKHSMENIETTTHLGDKLILAGGVTKSPLWKQIFADVTGYPVVCPDMDVEANLGDVYLAGVGTGAMDYSDIEKHIILNKSVEPNPDNQKIYASYYQHYKSLYESLKGNMQEMALLQEELQHRKAS